jgi:phosphonoacetate hydrolase
METTVIVCLDGISPEYLDKADTPFLDGLARDGTSLVSRAMVPTVTNVNNASIITASSPENHGITSNYYYDRERGREIYMDSGEYLKCETLLEKATQEGQRTLLLTVKDKLRRLLSKGATHSYSLERPDEKIVKHHGPPPGIYTPDSSIWLIEVAIYELEKGKWDHVYVSTTDYVPHKHPPEAEESRNYLSKIDKGLEALNDRGVILGITADHGMNPKTVNLDPFDLLSQEGISNRVIGNIKDEHVIHHRNLGGSAYIYMDKGNYVEKSKEILADTEGVEHVLTRGEAHETYGLDPSRIGDLLVLADKDYTLGPNKGSIYREIDIRSHGSLHEREVPLIINRRIDPPHPTYNKDLIPLLLN